MDQHRHDTDNAGAPSGGDKPTGTTDPAIRTEDELASDFMGNNQLHGRDQSQEHNERKVQSGVKHEANSDPLESFKELDKPEDKDKPGF